VEAVGPTELLRKLHAKGWLIKKEALSTMRTWLISSYHASHVFGMQVGVVDELSGIGT
jgi:hypothetical protein